MKGKTGTLTQDYENKHGDKYKAGEPISILIEWEDEYYVLPLRKGNRLGVAVNKEHFKG